MRVCRDRAVVLRQHKLGEADRMVTLLTPRRVGPGGGQGRAAYPQQVRGTAGAVRAHGRSAAPRPQSRHRHPGAGHRRVRHRHRQRLRPLHLRVRGAGNRRAPGRRGAGPDARAAPADGRRVAGRRRRQPSRDLVLDAYLLRAMGIAGWAPALTDAPAVPLPVRIWRSTSPPVAACAYTAGHPGRQPAARRAGFDGRAARWRLGGRAGVAAVVPQPASGLVAAHLQWHLERQLRTLPLVERVYRVDRTLADHRVSLFGQDVPHGDEADGPGPLPQLHPA